MKISARVDFNRLGVTLQKEIAVPFPGIHLDIEVATDASEQQMAAISDDLPKFCPVSKVMTQAGTRISTEWTTRKL